MYTSYDSLITHILFNKALNLSSKSFFLVWSSAIIISTTSLYVNKFCAHNTSTEVCINILSQENDVDDDGSA